MRPHLCKGCGGEIWRPEPTPQQGAAPVSARECAEWLVGERGTHAVDDASALIDAYAERVADARVAEAGVYAEIRQERVRQDAQWGGPDHDDHHLANDWMVFIENQAARVLRDFNADRLSTGLYRERLVKIAALAVAALESHDRIQTYVGIQEADRAE